VVERFIPCECLGLIENYENFDEGCVRCSLFVVRRSSFVLGHPHPP